MNEWNQHKLGELITLKRGYDLPERERQSGIYPIVSSSGITDHHNAFMVNPPCVATGRYGTLGKIHFVEQYCWPLNTTLYVKDFKGNDPKFIYYFLQTLGLEEFNCAAAVPGLDRNVLHKIGCLFPNDLNIQQGIASILSNYDELIEVNNQRIKLLEEAARELYKEWFVRMRFPGYKEAKFVRGMPMRWEIKSIGKVIDFQIGGGWGNDKADHEFSVPGYVIRGTDIPKVRVGKANVEVYRFHKASNIKSRQLIEGDIVFETAGGSEGQALGRTCFITQELLDSYGDKVIAASFCKQIRTTTIPSLYLYYFLNYLYDSGMIEAFQIQSTGISNYQFEPFLKFQQIILPTCDLMQSFHDKVLAIQRQISILGQQNTHLRQIRDRLLPRLISGKLAIKEKPEQAKVVSMAESGNIAAEDASTYNNASGKKVYFQRRVLAAYIIDHLWNEPSFGHVKLMKLMYLSEHLAEIETAGNYHRDAAGPYDNQMLRSIDKQLKVANWFDCRKIDQRFTYHPLDNAHEYKEWFQKYFADKEEGIQKLLQLFGKKKTEKVEMVATIYEVYRDLKSRRLPVTDDVIIYEVWNWHDRKRRIEESRWRVCLNWMKEKGWVDF